tara:strand:+ start:203 stop:610 length:408 start_codon:yes stop_codon:yes gene_type:complete
MAHPIEHAKSSAKKYGGKAEDYLPLHKWFDESKSMVADFRHRSLRHHSEGIFLLEKEFGTTITNSDGKEIPTRYIGEQHVFEDLGRIPSFKDYTNNMFVPDWLRRGNKLSHQIQGGNDDKTNEQDSSVPTNTQVF